ncbi:MAG: putative porin [Bacteroidales bacterium]
MRRFILYIGLLFVAVWVSGAFAANKYMLEPSYAWGITEPLGEHYPSTIDTLQHNYYKLFVPSMISTAYATTGNYGSEGQNQIFFQRDDMSSFFFDDALSNWLPSVSTMRYYNTRVPMTLLSFATGGDDDDTQDHLKGVFSANANSKLAFGANVDYIYSRGSYANQAMKNITWGLSSSYMGDRYEMQTFFKSYDSLNKENGGITDDLYITNTALVQYGLATIDPKDIPTNLSDAHSHVKGFDFYLNQRYKLGYYQVERDSVIQDSIIKKTYIPVTSVIWTTQYNSKEHIFVNESASQDTAFFENSYLSLDGSYDQTKYWSLSNTVGLSLLEGFNKYAKFGLAAYVTYEHRYYKLASDSALINVGIDSELTPFPTDVNISNSYTEDLVWVGGELTKRMGRIVTYNAKAQFGLVGSVIGDVEVDGSLTTRFKLLGDSVTINAYGFFKNSEAPYLMNNYISNHYIWQNDFGKTRTFRLGGELKIPHTRSYFNVGYETLQNHIYFDTNGTPAQESGAIHIFMAQLKQNFKVGILNWDNDLIYQTTSNSTVLPLPTLSVYSNLYLQFKIAKVLHAQIGVDCNYYTKYFAPAYNPATMTFYNQEEKELGNYPFMNAYANFKLKTARFYVIYSHMNQGWFSNDYFSVLNYPLNPSRIQFGVSVDFAN